MTTPLLAPYLRVRLKTCGHCIDEWITERRANEDRGITRDPSVPCEWDHRWGVVMPYEREYSHGTFAVRFDDGVWRLVTAADVVVEEPGTSVVRMRRPRATRRPRPRSQRARTA